MRRAPGLFLTLLLALTLAFSGASRAAGLLSAEGTSMIICADGGAVAITLDAEGNPVAPGAAHRHCPDCFAPAGAALADHPPSAVPATFVARSFAVPLTHVPRPARHTRPEPRGPPTETMA